MKKSDIDAATQLVMAANPLANTWKKAIKCLYGKNCKAEEKPTMSKLRTNIVIPDISILQKIKKVDALEDFLKNLVGNLDEFKTLVKFVSRKGEGFVYRSDPINKEIWINTEKAQ